MIVKRGLHLKKLIKLSLCDKHARTIVERWLYKGYIIHARSAGLQCKKLFVIDKIRCRDIKIYYESRVKQKAVSNNTHYRSTKKRLAQ